MIDVEMVMISDLGACLVIIWMPMKYNNFDPVCIVICLFLFLTIIIC